MRLHREIPNNRFLQNSALFHIVPKQSRPSIHLRLPDQLQECRNFRSHTLQTSASQEQNAARQGTSSEQSGFDREASRLSKFLVGSHLAHQQRTRRRIQAVHC
jgi:hypothetical protein